MSQLETARSHSNYFEAPQTRIAWHFIILWIFFVLEIWSENKALWLKSIYLYIDRHVPYIFILISPLTYCLSVRSRVLRHHDDAGLIANTWWSDRTQTLRLKYYTKKEFFTICRDSHSRTVVENQILCTAAAALGHRPFFIIIIFTRN